MPDEPHRKDKKRDLTSGPLLSNLIRLAGPLAAGMMLHAFYSIADAFWLGKLSKEALAAPGVSMPFFFFVISFGMGFGNAGTALVAQYTGAKRYLDADRAAGQVFLVLCSVASFLALPLVLFAPFVLRIYQVPEEMAPQASVYFRIMLLAIPLTAFNIAYGSVLRALGDTVTVVLIGLVTNIINVILDPFLIFGWSFFPEMGVAGAALASVFAQAVSAVACYVLLRRGRAGLKIHPRDLKPDWPILKKTFAIGLPAAIGNSSNSLGFMGFQTMINILGTNVIGAFTIGFRIMHFFSVPGRALALAAAPIVGQALGAGKPALARRAVRLSATIVALGMLLPVAFVMWQGQFVATLFAPDTGVVKESGRFFLIVPASSYCFSVIMVLMAAFYGSGHTWPPMFLSLLRLWVLRIPVGYFLGFVIGLKSTGVYTGMAVGNIVSALLALWFFRRGNWQRSVVSAEPPDASES